MRRTWLLAFLFLTLWQMLPHEGYNMLYAQDMGNESYGGGFDCEDDDGFGAYYSSLPCEDTPCVTTCPDCQVTLACDDLDDHACAGNITCSACGKSMTSEEYHNHNCHSSWSGGGGYNPPEEDTPPTTNTDPTPNNPPFQEEEETGNSNSNNNTTNKTPSKSNVTEEKLINYFKSSIYNRTYSSKTCGYCLRGWKTIWQKAGLGEYADTGKAKNFGSKLLQYGFKEIYSGTTRPPQYIPQIGDTRIWESYTGQPSQAGHIDWWNGTHWVSDYVQQGDWYPGRKYQGVTFKIYR